MTKNKALEILKNSELASTWTNGDETWNYQVGDLLNETPECFIFIVYPHSNKSPFDLDYSFLFYVMKETGEVYRSDSFFTEKEIKKFRKKI